ncbi:RcnB family protein [Novosphingobium resinovorum]|uniref:RcnB family protein n=1 Tax=Novosphingobium resinovorum TaxID=158500 RepID=UPI002ED612B7|nr:RcnB family protein [Novosphingobium resinovorum]
MKKFTAALLGAALLVPSLAAPAMAQPARHDDHRPGQKNAGPQKDSYKTFRKGQKFDRRYARNYQEVDYRKYRNVKAPPRGYRYVRSGNDMLLVGITSGIIASVIAGQFR